MAEYSLSATLRARDAGFSSTIQRAQREAAKLESTAGKLKREQDLRMKVGVEGMARIERLKGAIEAARNNANKPLSVKLKDAATQQLNKIKSQVNSLTSKAHNVVVNIKTNGAEKLKGIKNSISEGVGGAAMGMGATMLGTAGIGYGVVNAVQSQMDFEKQMSSVKAIMSSTYSGAELEKEITRLTTLAEKMGATTKFTSKESGQALYYMAMAGWDANKMIAGLPAVLNLAAAGNVELAAASDIVTDSMTAFGLKAGDTVKMNGKMVEMSQHYSDMMAALVTSANTDVLMEGEALKYAAPVVGALYADGTNEQKMLGAQDLMLTTGVMANAGIKGSQAGTSARALFTRLASEQRNAKFALQALGVDFTDENYGGKGDVRRMKDIFDDLRTRFREGVDTDTLLGFEEFLSGTKLHADTRRKLEGFLKHAQENGGKLTGGEKTKMAAMLNGQEGMSGLLAILTASDEDWAKLQKNLENCEGAAERMAKIQMDNLAGSITYLGSAWDAFQRSFVKGSAGEGLRSFVDSVTDSLSKANKLFADGVDFSDLVSLGADAVNKLKNKFLELDGIGSILAGGALFWGLKKILSMGLSVKNTIGDLMKIRTAADLGNAIKGKTAGGLQSAAAMNVNTSTMNVKAGVVNLSGPVKGGQSPAGGQAGGRGSTVLTNQQRVNDYYARKQQILTSGTTSGRAIPPAAAAGGRLAALRGAGGAIGGAGAFAAIFGLMDVFAARSNSEYNNAKAVDELKLAQAELKSLQEQGADINQINAQLSAIKTAEENVQNVAEMNRVNERRTNSGVTGMIAGTMAGAALGSVVPIVGTLVGGLLGGILGQIGGVELADYFEGFKPSKKKKTYGLTSVSALDEEDPAVTVSKMSTALSRRREADRIERERPAREKALSESVLSNAEYSSATSRRRAADEQERINRQQENYQAQITATARRRQADIVEAENRRKEAYNAEIQANIKEHQRQENLKNFGYTTLGQDFSTQPEAKVRAIDYKKQYTVGAEESARQRGVFNRQATGQEYVNLNQGALTNWVNSLKAKFTGNETPAQERNFNYTQPLAATTAAAVTQPAAQNTFDFDKFKSRFIGTEPQKLTQPLAANAAYIPSSTPYQNLDKSAVNLSKSFDNLKVQFGGADKTVQERNFAQPMASTQAKVQAQSPMVNLNRDAFNLSAFIGSLKERFSSAETPAQERQFNYSQPMANSPNYGANVQAMGLPNVELPELNLKDKLSAEFESISAMASTAWAGLTDGASTAFDSLSTSISTGLESAKTALSTFGSEISMLMGTGFETLRTSAATIFDEIAMSMSTGLATLQASLSTVGESISMSFSGAFETISAMAAATFSSLGATISGGVEAARATITTAFSSAASEVQAIWGAIPGFFSGIFGGLGGIAAGAGAAIAAGINSGIGMIMGAWEALSGWLSAKISSLASMASSAAASIGIGGNAKGTASWRGGLTQVNEHGGELIILPSGKEIYPYETTQNVLQEQKIAHNAKGTSFFSGGWSEVNEHGGELMYLPTGTQIIPHATTVRIIRQQVKEKLNDTQSSTTSAVFSKNAGTSLYDFGTSSKIASTFGDVTNNTANAQGYFGSSRTFDNRSTRSYQSLTRFENNVDELGNLKGVDIPEYNRITAEDSLMVKKAKQEAQRRQINIAHNYTGTSYFKGGLTTVNEHGGEIISLPDGKNILPQYTFQNIFRDSLGNIQGLNIPEYNRITENDSIAVKRAKQQAQYRQYRDQLKVDNLSTKSPAVEKSPNAVQDIKQTPVKKNSLETLSQAMKYLPSKGNSIGNFPVSTPPTFPTASGRPANRNSLETISQAIKYLPGKSGSMGNFPISTPPTFPTGNSQPTRPLDKLSLAMQYLPRQSKTAKNLYDGLINTWQQVQQVARPGGNISGDIWQLQKNFATDDNQLNQLSESNIFNSNQLGDLPVPELNVPKNTPASTTNTSTTNNNQTSSNVNFNFGGVNISNGLNFDEFTHKLTTLFSQGTANSVQI